MAKYHITAKGTPGVCKAKPGSCPMGDELEHYSTPEDAMTAFEKVMSGRAWTGFSKGKKWNSLSWAQRKIELNNLVSITLRRYLKRDDFRIKLIPKWENTIAGKERILGFTRWSAKLDEDDWTEVSLSFSEKLENLTEGEAKEVIAHELAHIILSGSHDDANGGHSTEWEQLTEEILRDFGFNTEITARTIISTESFNRVQKRKSANLAARWKIECSNGHVYWSPALNPIRGPCFKCITFNMESEITITNWRK